MTKRKTRKLSHEILGLLGISFAIALFLFEFLSTTADVVIWNYHEAQNISLSYGETEEMQLRITGVSLVTAAAFFVTLFLSLLGQKLAYIRSLTKGVEALQTHRMDFVLPLEGNNELTQLAETINYLSATEKQMQEKERALQAEKELLIRTLSHDIRTPLTSILSYSEYLASAGDCPAEERQRQLRLIKEKAEQIRELTDILLQGGQRDLEYFEDARLLMEQLAGEFEESLEDEFAVTLDLTGCAAFSGSFDVQELRRIFDNLISNAKKYADPAQPVTLRISAEEQGLVIRQENGKRQLEEKPESYRVGLTSIRRIAQNYGGQAEVQEDEAAFAIAIRLSRI